MGALDNFCSEVEREVDWKESPKEEVEIGYEVQSDALGSVEAELYPGIGSSPIIGRGLESYVSALILNCAPDNHLAELGTQWGRCAYQRIYNFRK